jgi:hypothetical protein
MKSLFIGILLIPSSLMALSLWSPYSELNRLHIEETDFSGDFSVPMKDSLIEIGKKHGYKIEITNRTGEANDEFIDKSLNPGGLSFYSALTAVYKNENRSIELLRGETNQHIKVFIYKPIKVNSMRVVSTLPAWTDESLFSSYFTFDSFVSKKEISNALEINYNSHADLINIAGHLNRLIAIGGELDKPKAPDDLGFIAEINTSIGPIRFALGKRGLDWINTIENPDVLHAQIWMMETIVDMLPEEYSLRMNELLDPIKESNQMRTSQDIQ